MGLKLLLIPILHVPLTWLMKVTACWAHLSFEPLLLCIAMKPEQGDQRWDDPSKTWRFWQICRYHHKRKMNFIEVCALLPCNRPKTDTTKGESKAFRERNTSSTNNVCLMGTTSLWHPKGSTLSESIFLKSNLIPSFNFEKSGNSSGQIPPKYYIFAFDNYQK